MEIRDYTPDEEIDVKKYFVLVLKRWRWFIISLVACVALALFLTKSVHYTFTSIQIKDLSQSGGVDNILQQLGTNRSSNSKNLETELVILQSLDLTKKTLQQLEFDVSYYHKAGFRNKELYKEAPFVINLDVSHSQTYYTPVKIKILNEEQFEIEVEGGADSLQIMDFGAWYISDDFVFQVEKQSWVINYIGEEYYFHINNVDQMAKQYQNRIRAELANEDATIIAISITGDMKNKNIDFLNKLTSVYIQDNLDEKNEVALNTINFIDMQLNRIVDSLQIAEDDLQMFRQSNKIIDLSREGSSLFDKLEDLQSQKSILDVKIKYYNYLLDYIEKNNDFKDIISPSIMGIEDQLLNKLVGDLSAYNQEKKVLEYSVQGKTPQMDIINVRIKNTMESLIEVLTNILQRANIEKNDIVQKVAKLDRQISKLPWTERNMIRIQRKFELNDNIYNFLQQKRAEAGIASASNVSDSRVVDYASQETSSSNFMKILVSYFLAVVFSFIIPIVLVVFLELISKEINYIGDVVKSTNIPLVGLIPVHSPKVEHVVADKTSCYLSESFRALRANFLVDMDNKTPYVFAVSSLYNGEKKTFCSLNLALTFSFLKKRVLLVDFDVRNPVLSENLGVVNDRGAYSYLSEKTEFYESLSKSQYKYIDIVPGARIENTVGEKLWTDRLRQFFVDARERFDIIIVDCPPIGLVSDSQAIFQHADFQLLCLRQSYSLKNSFVLMNELYRSYENSMKLIAFDVDNSSGLEYAKQSGGFKLKKKYRNGYYD